MILNWSLAKMTEEDCWVFDSLVAFLNGPVWSAPLQTFIEERSLIFEPNDSDHDADYRKVFDDFKNLVDFMLGNFMEDIGITPKQFETACLRGVREAVPLHFDISTFEQIWAANDFPMFKQMMTQRNVELQLQALQLIEQKYGKTPESFIPHKKGEQSHSEGTTAEISPTKLKTSDFEKEVLEEVSKQFPIEKDLEEEERKEEEIKYLRDEKINLEETLKKTIEEKLSTQKHILEKQFDETDEEKEGEREETERADTPIQFVVKPKPERIAIDRPQNIEVDNRELQKRQEYLRAQRDKLVALKKEVRKKHLDEDTADKNGGRNRPKSAKAAEVLMAGGSAIEPQKMKLRKALVQKLKTEVIGKE